MESPPAIMEGCPSPGIVGIPIPTTITVNPTTVVTIRPPRWIPYRHCRSPAPTIITDVNPSSVGLELLMEIFRCHGSGFLDRWCGVFWGYPYWAFTRLHHGIGFHRHRRVSNHIVVWRVDRDGRTPMSQKIIPLHHQTDDLFRNTDVLEVDHLIRIQGKWLLTGLYVSGHDCFGHQRFMKLDHLHRRGTQFCRVNHLRPCLGHWRLGHWRLGHRRLRHRRLFDRRFY